MQYFKKLSFKTTLLTFFPLIVGSSKGNAFNPTIDLPLPMAVRLNDFSMAETREFLLTGDGILLIGFVLWVAYIVFLFPKDTFKKV